MYKTLAELEKGEVGEVVGFDSGHMPCRRLESMGVRQGKTVTRVSSQLMGGPITISVDGRQTAMGRGIASKVKVKLLERENSGRMSQN